jgi:membrane dipeptidase
MALGGENTVCFGCDFDGAPIPEEIGDISGMGKISGALKKAGYCDELTEKIMYKNADRFIERNLRLI